jgi:hypothetical protein
MSEENLAEGLNESYRSHQRDVAIRHLADPKRRMLTMGQIAKLTTHDEHGTVVATITLHDLIEAITGGGQPAAKAAKPSPKAAPKTAPAKPAAKKGPAPKAPAAKKAAKAAAPKKTPAPKKGAAPKKAAAPKGDKGPKADKGKPKPRLDYDTGKRELLAALKTAKAKGADSLGRSAIEEATGFTGVQVRTFAKKLAEEGKVKILGEGGRSTTYAVM